MALSSIHTKKGLSPPQQPSKSSVLPGSKDRKRKTSHGALPTTKPAEPATRLEILSKSNADSDRRIKGKQKQLVQKPSGKGDPGEDEESGASESEDDVEDGPFPELFLSEDEAQEDGSGSDLDGAEEDESDYPEEDVDDAELGSLLDDSSDDGSAEDLDGLIARSSSKPNETDPGILDGSISSMPKETDYMKQARSKLSAFVEGVKINVWDEIEPGYGSESSTEDVESIVLSSS